MPVCSTLLLLSPSALFFPTLHTVPLSLTPFFSPPPSSHSQNGWSQRPQWRFPWVLTSATRHKRPTSSCGKTTWHQTGCFVLLRPSLLRLVLQCLVYRLYYYPVFFFCFVVFLFPPNLRGDMRHNWSQITWITVIPSVISPSQINLLNAIGTAAPPINTLIRKSVEDGGDRSCPKCHSPCVTYKTMRGETFHPSTKQERERTCPPITLSPLLYEGLRRLGSIFS